MVVVLLPGVLLFFSVLKLIRKMKSLDGRFSDMFEMENENCSFSCLCRSCANPDCIRSFCTSLPTIHCARSGCSMYETQGHYYYDDDGNEYWIGKDNRRHYTRNEG